MINDKNIPSLASSSSEDESEDESQSILRSLKFPSCLDEVQVPKELSTIDLNALHEDDQTERANSTDTAGKKQKLVGR